ncbi:hypothetical protein MUK42_01481 [Musa troglodytarum]|uniref:Uncharacterized protein n=1 Tax=Musa troglodytarum TaxID=320322 RepID=A0A9E7JV64_9LILI|nr:hypothetical protein MUK42_01481 [Musa troglodytarum]
MGRGRFKAKPTGRRNFSTPEEMGFALTFLAFLLRSWGFLILFCRFLYAVWVVLRLMQHGPTVLLAPQLVLAPSKRPQSSCNIITDS